MPGQAGNDDYLLSAVATSTALIPCELCVTVHTTHSVGHSLKSQVYYSQTDNPLLVKYLHTTALSKKNHSKSINEKTVNLCHFPYAKLVISALYLHNQRKILILQKI